MTPDDEMIEELTLVLLHLTSWTEKALDTTVHRSWKGYPFETLDALEAKALITQRRGTKSAYLTDAGLARARELEKKYRR